MASSRYLRIDNLCALDALGALVPFCGLSALGSLGSLGALCALGGDHQMRNFVLVRVTVRDVSFDEKEKNVEV